MVVVVVSRGSLNTYPSIPMIPWIAANLCFQQTYDSVGFIKAHTSASSRPIVIELLPRIQETGDINAVCVQAQLDSVQRTPTPGRHQ